MKFLQNLNFQIFQKLITLFFFPFSLFRSDEPGLNFDVFHFTIYFKEKIKFQI